MPNPPPESTISLTLTSASENYPRGTIRVIASKLLAYDQQLGFTRLRLTGGTVLDVKESTNQIDRWFVVLPDCKEILRCNDRGAPGSQEERATLTAFDFAWEELLGKLAVSG